MRDGLAHKRVASISRSSAAEVIQKMQGYRAYVIGDDGRISHRHDFVCATDSEAKERAKQLVDGHAVELWQLDRKIDTFNPRK